MSEDCHESEAYYQCTCCGIKDYTPGARCGCASEFCRECHRCLYCCKSPAQHEYLRRVRESDAAGLLSEADKVRIAQDLFPGVKFGQIRDIVRRPTTSDMDFLKDCGIAWEGDNRNAGL